MDPRIAASLLNEEPVDPAERKRRGLVAFGAGALDAGGVGSGAMEYFGYPDAAAALRDAVAVDEGASGWGQMLNPLSLLPILKDGAVELWDAATSEGPQPPKLKTRDEFFQERRKPVQSVAEAKAAARERAMASDAYKLAVAEGAPKRAERIAKAAEASAEDALAKDTANAASDDSNIQADYDAYKADYDRQLEAFYGRSFAERNPDIAKALPALGGIGAALLTRRGLNRIADKTDELAAAVTAARAGGKPSEIAAAEAAASQYAAKAGGLTGETAKAYGKGALVPLELQGLGDFIDAKGTVKEYQDSSGEWQPSRAAEKAIERWDPISNPQGFVADKSMSVLSGIVGAATGGSLARKPAFIPDGPTPQDYARALDEVAGGINVDRTADALRAAPPPQIGSTTPVAPGTPVGPVVGLQVASQTRRQPNRQSPAQPPQGAGQPASPSSYAPGSPANLQSRQVVADMLLAGDDLLDPAAIAAKIRASGSTFPQGKLTKRAAGTSREAQDLRALGVNINDPTIVQQVAKKLTPGTQGMLALPLASGAGAGAMSYAPEDDPQEIARQLMARQLMEY